MISLNGAHSGVRTRPGGWMLLRAPFSSSFVLERSVLTASVRPALVGGCSVGPLWCFFFKRPS